MRLTTALRLSLCLGITTACGESPTSDSGAETAAGSSTAGGPADSGTGKQGTSLGSSGVADDSSTGAGATGTSSASEDGASETAAMVCPDVGDACTICESTQCPADYCGCFNNGSCVLLAQCTAACEVGDAECNQACWTQYPEGISDGALLTHCAATTCTADCGPFVPLNSCQQCLYRECQPQMNVCVANPDCTELLECLDACVDPGCESTCYTAHPDGLADSGPVGDCAQETCTEACA